MPASVNARAALYKRALGQCAMPGCGADLQVDTKSGPQFVAQAAHIHGENEGSARYMPEVPLEERNAIGNLVLMCPTHHTQIDANEDEWPAERLRELKRQQEQRAYQILQAGRAWHQKFLTLDYLNVPRLVGMPGGAMLQIACERVGLQPAKTFRDIGWGVAPISAAAESLFEQWEARLTPLGEIDWSAEDAGVGQIVSFNELCYTRNGPTPGDDLTLTGNLAKDPHVWFRHDEHKVCVRYDPAWVTTSTAHVNLRSGTMRFAGFGIVMLRHDSETLISAWTLGQPLRA